jgi:hypothetical protein
MRRLRSFAPLLIAPFLFAALSAPALRAQKNKPEPLNETQIEQIREAGIIPNERVKLYTKFLNDYADTIKGLTGRAKSLSRTKRLDEELQNMTALMDEFGSNLDTYSDRHADIRVGLKPLPEAADHWLSVLRALPGEPAFDEARKEAIESGDDLAGQVKRLLSEQTDYFNIHKDERNQDRAEPK